MNGEYDKFWASYLGVTHSDWDVPGVSVNAHVANEIDKIEVCELFGEDFDRRIGPAFQGSLRPERFRPFESASVRELMVHDARALIAFREECGEDGLIDSAIDKTTLYRAAFFNQGQIIAVSGYRPWSYSERRSRRRPRAAAGDGDACSIRACG